MIEYIRLWAGLRADKRGVTAVEYAILAALIAVGLVASVAVLNSGIKGGFTNVSTLLGNTPTTTTR